MDKDTSKVYKKTKDIYIDISKDVKTRFDSSNYELDIPLLKKKKYKKFWNNDR